MYPVDPVWYWRQPTGANVGLLHSICCTRMLHSRDVEVSVDPMTAMKVWQEVEASIYMCCPVSVPHTIGGLGPVGLEIVRLSSEHCPFVPVVVEAPAITNFSKSTLIWQMSVDAGQTVYEQDAAVVVAVWATYVLLVLVDPPHPMLRTQQTPKLSAQVPLAVPLIAYPILSHLYFYQNLNNELTEHSFAARQVPLEPFDAPHGSLANLTILSSPSLSCLSVAFLPR